MPNIIDVIIHQPQAPYSAQTFVVLDAMPKRVYARDGHRLTSHDDGLYDFLNEAPGSRDAFAGAKFDLQLTDGSTLHCDGQVWAVGAPKGMEPVRQVGIGTIETLNRCYVFSGAYISVEKLDAWLAANPPSADYDKYDEQKRWWRHVLPTLRIVRNRKRAARLRRRGVDIKWEPRVRAWTWRLERRAVMVERSATDRLLWQEVQRIAYPKRSPSDHPPFPRDQCSPGRKPASWLYWELLDDAGLRAKVLP